MNSRNKLIDIACWYFTLTLLLFGSALFASPKVYAFAKLKQGFESITTTFLIPLSGAVAGCAFILFITLSYFKQEEHKKNVGNVLMLSILSAVGIDLINVITQSFS